MKLYAIKLKNVPLSDYSLFGHLDCPLKDENGRTIAMTPVLCVYTNLKNARLTLRLLKPKELFEIATFLSKE